MTASMMLNQAQSNKAELATKVAMYLGLCERIAESKEGSARRIEISEAATDTALFCMEKFGWEAWGDAVNKMTEQFPNHQWLNGYGLQVIWFVQN